VVACLVMRCLQAAVFDAAISGQHPSAHEQDLRRQGGPYMVVKLATAAGRQHWTAVTQRQQQHRRGARQESASALPASLWLWFGSWQLMPLRATSSCRLHAVLCVCAAACVYCTLYGHIDSPAGVLHVRRHCYFGISVC
jgi:hypothetical protein